MVMNVTITLYNGTEQKQVLTTANAPILDLISGSLSNLKHDNCNLAKVADANGELICLVHENGNVGQLNRVTNFIEWKKVRTQTSPIMNVTEKELAVLKSIINNDYQTFDIEDKNMINQPTWTFVCEDSGVKGKSLSGVISSLSKKGLVESDYDGKNVSDSTILITEAGYNALQG
jgi:DNA-binding MarR family transcriptional regulator